MKKSQEEKKIAYMTGSRIYDGGSLLKLTKVLAQP